MKRKRPTRYPSTSRSDPRPFQLPSDVTISRERLADGFAYLFRHRTLGVLGRMLVQDRSDRQCQISCEVAGDPADPMTARRAEIFGPLGIALSDRIAAASGPASALSSASPPPSPASPHEVIESKHIPCQDCGKMVAMLIFAPEARDPGGFEDYARKMYAQYTRRNVPTWIIGPALGSGPIEERHADILTVWPERAPIAHLRPSEFHPVIAKLASSHCASSPSSSPIPY